MALGVKKLFQHLDAQLHEIRNALFHKVAGDPGSPVEAQYWYDDTGNRLKYQDNAGTKTVAHTGELSGGSVTAVTGTAPIVSSGGIAPAISISAASGSAAGSMSTAHFTDVNDATAAATASKIVKRDANSRFAAADPSAGTDVANKQFVEAVLAGLTNKASVRAASTGNVAIATALENGDALDGVTLATGNRVLLAYQTDHTQDGIYIVPASGAASRATDADIDAEVKAGLYVFVSEGTVNGNKGFQLFTNDPIVVGTTALDFQIVSAAGQLVAGAGLLKTGDTIDAQVGFGTEIVGDAVVVQKALIPVEKSGLVGGAGPTTQYTITNPGFAANAIHNVKIQDVSTGEFEDMVGIQIEADGDIVVDFGIVPVAGTAYRYIAHGLAA